MTAVAVGLICYVIGAATGFFAFVLLAGVKE
jgi:hypothetical protein